MQAKKALGQNFLMNDTIIRQIVSLFCVTKNDLIIEIGPGRGALTKYLSKLDSRLICIEIDSDMKAILSKYESDKCQVIYNDILQVDLNKILKEYSFDNLYVIGNLPYYITSPIIEHLIESQLNIKQMAFMVQKEVADRYSAKPGTSEFGYMTLYLDYYYTVTKEITVPRADFNPVPKVDSAVIKLEKKITKINLDSSKYFNFLKEAFTLKRKTLKNNLRHYDWEKILRVLQEYGLNEKVRSEAISQEIFIDIFKELN